MGLLDGTRKARSPRVLPTNLSRLMPPAGTERWAGKRQQVGRHGEKPLKLSVLTDLW